MSSRARRRIRFFGLEEMRQSFLLERAICNFLDNLESTCVRSGGALAGLRGDSERLEMSWNYDRGLRID